MSPKWQRRGHFGVNLSDQNEIKDIKTTMVYAHYSPSEREADLIQQAFKGSEIPTDPGVLLEEEGAQSGPDPETTTANSGQLDAMRSVTNRPPSS